MLPAIPDAVMAEAIKVARKAFRWHARGLERYWKSVHPERPLDKIIAYHDLDYGDSYCFASWAANVVFLRAGFAISDDDIIYDGDIIELDPRGTPA